MATSIAELHAKMDSFGIWQTKMEDLERSVQYATDRNDDLAEELKTVKSKLSGGEAGGSSNRVATAPSTANAVVMSGVPEEADGDLTKLPRESSLTPWACKMSLYCPLSALVQLSLMHPDLARSLSVSSQSNKQSHC